jgi:hypothetical protein
MIQKVTLLMPVAFPSFWESCGFLVAIFALVATLSQRAWGWAALWYLAAGTLWLRTERARPEPDQLHGAGSRGGRLLLCLFWPLTLALAAQQRWRRLQDPQRFIVAGPDADQFFPNLEPAIACARGLAAASDTHDCMIFDFAHPRWDTEVRVVDASGTVRTVRRRRIDPTRLTNTSTRSP